MKLLVALAAGTGLATTVTGFLIPPQIAEVLHTSDAAARLMHNAPVEVVELECPGCKYMEARLGFEGGNRWQEGVENVIRLELTADVEHGLSINGHTAMPADFGVPQPVALSAPQIRTDTGERSPPLSLDFALERLEPIQSTDTRDRNNQVIPVKFTILAVAGQPVQVDTLSIDLLQTEKKLVIARVQRIPFGQTSGAMGCQEATKWSICRIKAMVLANIQDVTSVMKTKAQQAKGWMKHGGCGGNSSGSNDKVRILGGKDHRRPHRHHRHHTKDAEHPLMRQVAHYTRQTIRFFIIPALLGVIVGLTASAIGMIFGQLIAYLWVRFVRGRNGIAFEDDDSRYDEFVVSVDEKEILLVEALMVRDPPPQYEHAPRYEDVEATAANEQ